MSPRRQAGISLIEAILATSIGLILLLAVMRVFAASQAAYSISQGLARVQENGRFAMEYLNRDVRMAGHMGCTNDSILAQNAGTSGFLEKYTMFGTAAPSALLFNYSIQGYEAAGTAPHSQVNSIASLKLGGAFQPALPADLAAALNNRIAGSDILVLRYLDGAGVPIVELASGRAPVLAVDAAGSDWELLRGGIDQPGLYGLSDCYDMRLFQAETVAGGRNLRVGGVSDSLNLGKAVFDFRAGSMLYRAESEVYYIGLNVKTQRPSLYRLRFMALPGHGLSYEKQELVDGVENMQLLYGLSGPGTRDGVISQLQTAAEIDSLSADAEFSWRRVATVQIGLVLASPEAASSPKSKDKLIAQGVTFSAPDDGRIRSVYQRVVTLRNRLYGN